MRLSRPRFWEFLNSLIGAAGLALAVSSSRIANEFLADKTNQTTLGQFAQGLIILVGALIFSVAAVRLFRAYQRRRFPFIFDEMAQIITFERNEGNAEEPVIGYSKKHYWMRVLKSQPHFDLSIDSSQLVHDESTITESDLMRSINYRAHIHNENGVSFSEIVSNPEKMPSPGKSLAALKTRPQLSQYRKLSFNLQIPPDFRSEPIYFIEEMKLPGLFKEDDEYYDISIHNPVTKRYLRMEFVNIDLMRATWKRRKGSKLEDPQKFEIKNRLDEDGNKIFYIEKTWDDLELGTTLEISWHWDYGQIQTKTKTV